MLEPGVWARANQSGGDRSQAAYEEDT